MDNLKIKFNRLIIAAVLIFNINIAIAVTPFFVPQFVIEEDIMRVNTGNEQTISSVQFYHNNVLIEEQEGCQSSNCIFSLNSLESGTYNVIVTLSNGVISEIITIN